MAVIRTAVLRCDECDKTEWVSPNWTDQDVRDIGSNHGWCYTKNGTDWCRQCASANKREGE